ncbi:MAG: tRNA lysidine(34) synthetase TilS, partial [Bacteroidota bacterium]
LLRAESYDFALAHVNYRLRGKASDGDAAFVADLARTLGARFFQTAADVKTDPEKLQYGESTQMAARRLRYKYFGKIMDEYNYSFTLTAHHAGDGLETTLLTLVRGSNHHGLLPLRPVSERVRRPLLESGREAIERYARDHGIKWREDGSNATDAYLRNRIRHHLLPFLDQQFGLRPEGWTKTQRQMWRDREMIELGERTLRERYYLTEESVLSLERTDPELEAALLRTAAPVRGFTPEQIRQMQVIQGTAVLSSRRWRVEINPQRFRFSLREDSGGTTVVPVRIEQLPYVSGRVHLSLEPRPMDLRDGRALYLAPPSFPLHLRPRQNGDRFQPLGMGGKTKKLQDYFVDLKVPEYLRDRIPLLIGPDGDIMAVG